jgi:hypothetical protein
MFRLLILAGLGVAGYLAWKRLMASDDMDDFDDEMWDSAAIHQQGDAQPVPAS